MKNKDDISKLIEVAKRRMKSVNVTDLNSIIISNEENMPKKDIVSRTNPYTLKKEKVVRSIGIGDRKIGGKPAGPTEHLVASLRTPQNEVNEVERTKKKRVYPLSRREESVHYKQGQKNERKRRTIGGTAGSGGTVSVAFKGCVPEIPDCHWIELDCAKLCHCRKWNQRNE